MRIISFLILTFFTLSVCNAQEMQPEEIAKLYFSKDTTGISQYLCCEVTKVPIKINRETDYPSVETEVAQLDSLDTVVSATLSLDTTSTDVYLFFRYDRGWKLEAIRRLKWHSFYLQMIEQHENMPQNYIDTLKSMGKWEEQLKVYSTLKIISGSDKKTIAYFNENRSKFEELLSESKNKLSHNYTYSIDGNSIATLTSLGNNLLLSEISRDISPIGIETPGIIYFLFWGTLDNSMGFMYLDEDSIPPRMDKKGFLIIREIGNGWYLFKTT